MSNKLDEIWFIGYPYFVKYSWEITLGEDMGTKIALTVDRFESSFVESLIAQPGTPALDKNPSSRVVQKVIAKAELPLQGNRILSPRPRRNCVFTRLDKPFSADVAGTALPVLISSPKSDLPFSTSVFNSKAGANTLKEVEEGEATRVQMTQEGPVPQPAPFLPHPTVLSFYERKQWVFSRIHHWAIKEEWLHADRDGTIFNSFILKNESLWELPLRADRIISAYIERLKEFAKPYPVNQRKSWVLARVSDWDIPQEWLAMDQTGAIFDKLILNENSLWEMPLQGKRIILLYRDYLEEAYLLKLLHSVSLKHRALVFRARSIFFQIKKKALLRGISQRLLDLDGDHEILKSLRADDALWTCDTFPFTAHFRNVYKKKLLDAQRDFFVNAHKPEVNS